MNKEQLLTMAKNPNNIPGIYNYCDAWCERCAFTSRCLNFAMVPRPLKDTGDTGNDFETLWKRIEECFKVTLEMIRDDAAKFGIDLNNLPEVKMESSDDPFGSENHPTGDLAHRYSFGSHKWFEGHKELFEEKERSLQKEAELGIEDPVDKAVRISEAVEVIQWYQFLISAKTVRALSGKRVDAEWDDDEEMKDFPKDSDGSAKVALIGIDRSIGAWGLLYNEINDESESILTFLKALTELRKALEEEFPNARTFVRPGFDQEISPKV